MVVVDGVCAHCACGCFFFLMMRRPPGSTLFPYPPLFRSGGRGRGAGVGGAPGPVRRGSGGPGYGDAVRHTAGLCP